VYYRLLEVDKVLDRLRRYFEYKHLFELYNQLELILLYLL